MHSQCNRPAVLEAAFAFFEQTVLMQMENDSFDFESHASHVQQGKRAEKSWSSLLLLKFDSETMPELSALQDKVASAKAPSRSQALTMS